MSGAGFRPGSDRSRYLRARKTRSRRCLHHLHRWRAIPRSPSGCRSPLALTLPQLTKDAPRSVWRCMSRRPSGRCCAGALSSQRGRERRSIRQSCDRARTSRNEPSLGFRAGDSAQSLRSRDLRGKRSTKADHLCRIVPKLERRMPPGEQKAPEFSFRGYLICRRERAGWLISYASWVSRFEIRTARTDSPRTARAAFRSSELSSRSVCEAAA